MRKKPTKTSPAGSKPGNGGHGTAPEQELPACAEAKYLHQLEEENRRLKLAVADLTLRNQALKLVVGKKW